MATASDEALARTVRCPRCGAQPHFACRTAAVRWKSLKHPHAERVTAAKSTTREK